MPEPLSFAIGNLAVPANVNVQLVAEDIEIGAVEIKDTATDLRATVVTVGAQNALVVTLVGGGGGAIGVKGVPGANLDDNADVAVNLPLGTIAALPVIPANSRRVKIQNTVPATIVRVRKAGAGAGKGYMLAYLGAVEYGGLDGALVNMEAELVSGTVNGAVMVQYERD